MAATSNAQRERALIELAHWLARVAQYSASHPSSLQMAQRAHTALTQALVESPVLEVGVLRDEITLGDTVASHPALRTRLGPCLHARGVLVCRFVRGVTLAELGTFVELLSLPAQSIFDRGGLQRLMLERGLARVQIEEIAHDITAEERDAQRRRGKLRTFFKDMLRELLARRGADAVLGEHLVELLKHPEIAVTILEEDPVGLAEAAAGLALMTQQEQQRTGQPLAPQLRAVLLALGPPSRDRLLRGFPALVGEFRDGLAWALGGFSEAELAHLAFPSVRAHPAALDVVLYAFTAAVPHDGTRLSSLRLLGDALAGLPSDEGAAQETLAALARPAAEYDSFRRERELLAEGARRALRARALTGGVASPSGSQPPPRLALEAFDGRRVTAEIVSTATRTRSFDRFCHGLPAIAVALAQEGADDAVLGLVRGLARVRQPEWREAASRAMQQIAATPAAARILVELEEQAGSLEGAQLDETIATVRLVAAQAPAAVLERLDVSTNRKLRRIMLDAIPLGGPQLLAPLRARLSSSSWFIVRNAAMLLAQVGGTGADLLLAAHHPDERVRVEIARSLRVLTLDAAAMEIAASYLTDPAAEVRLHARTALRGELLGPAAIAALERVLADDAQPEELRAQVVSALGRSTLDAAAQALFHAMQPRGLIDSGGASELRDLAAVALRGSRARAAQALFDEGLASSVRRVRKACQRAAEGA